ncbi:hypothetical protein KY285_013169 [Solanum tuberosum]|nr:hypothetical protein KY285_013169 [Solanum tuberosum]
MTNYESSSKLPISQEVENPSSFNFSIPPQDESPSTPVCGVGETDESITSPTEVMASPMLSSEDILACSPTLVLSDEKSQNSKAQSVGPESCTLAAGAELVAVQSLASQRGYVRPTLLEHELGSPDQVLHRDQPMFDQTPRYFDAERDKEEEEEGSLKWSTKGVRGANTFTMDVPNLETIKGTPEAALTVEDAECAKDRKKKRKRKVD